MKTFTKWLLALFVAALTLTNAAFGMKPQDASSSSAQAETGLQTTSQECVEQSEPCPICLEDLNDERFFREMGIPINLHQWFRPVNKVRSGVTTPALVKQHPSDGKTPGGFHRIHMNCLQLLIRENYFKCPVCLATIDLPQEYLENVSLEALLKMFQAYRKKYSDVSTNLFYLRPGTRLLSIFLEVAFSYALVAALFTIHEVHGDIVMVGVLAGYFLIRMLWFPSPEPEVLDSRLLPRLRLQLPELERQLPELERIYRRIRAVLLRRTTRPITNLFYKKIL